MTQIGPRPTRPHEGRTVLVTGAAHGIGQEYARRFAVDGARVVCADMAPMQETLALIRESGAEGIGHHCDVAAEDSVNELRAAVEAIGGVDILVHNAGIYPLQTFAEMTFADWRTVLSVNLDSLFLLTHAFLDHMAQQGWGRVIAISTSMLNSGSPGAAHYVASKGGIVGFVRAIATEIGPSGVTVNAISPGLIRSYGTETGPHEALGIFEAVLQAQSVKRTGVPSDLSGIVSFLASDEASFINGQTILVDGGTAHL